jgi:hypothetical protein
MGAQAQSNLAIPPELRAVPPRRARRYRRKWAFLLLLPYIFVGVALVGFLAAELLLVLATPPLAGQITQLFTTANAHGGSSYHVQYSYASNSNKYIGSDGVSAPLYHTLKNGMEVQVHAVSIGPWRIGEMEKPLGEYWSTRWPLWMAAVVWNLLVLLHLRVRSIPRRLIEKGNAVIGRVTEKQVIGRDSATARLRFTFNTRDGQSITAAEGVAAWRCPEINEGTQAVVIYDPAWPRRAILYECSDFHAE